MAQNSCKIHTVITDFERGEILCTLCGMVVVEKLEDQQHDGQYFDELKFNTHSRTGPSIKLAMHDKGLFTMIGNDKDSSGKPLSSKNRTTFYRLRQWDKRSKSVSLTRNLGTAFTLLHGMKTKLAIPDNVLEKTAYIYRKALEHQLMRGRSVPPLLLASLYAACRETNTPRTLTDLAKAGNIRKSALSRAHRLLVRSLDLKLEQYDITVFVNRMSNNLGFGEKTKRCAFDILEQSKNYKIVEGKNPVAFAAASLYLACLQNNIPITQGIIADASGISTVTIRNISSSIKKSLNLST